MTAQAVVGRIVALRRQRWTGRHVAMEVGVSPATVSRVLRRAGLSRLKELAPAEPVRRYEREHRGEMIHIDIKKLGRLERVELCTKADMTWGSGQMLRSADLRGWPSSSERPLCIPSLATRDLGTRARGQTFVTPRTSALAAREVVFRRSRDDCQGRL